MWPGTFIVRAPLLKDFEWNLFMCGTREKRWTKDPFWSGSLWLFMICLLIVLTVCPVGSEERGKNPGISQTRSFSWRKADMSQYHHLVRLPHIFVVFFCLSEWMWKAAVVRWRQSVNPNQDLICFALICLSLYLGVSAPRRGFCLAFLFSELMNLKPFFLWGALGGICITKAVLVLHTNDVTLWHAPRTAAALSMYVFPTHSIIFPLDTGCNQFLTHSISNSSYLCLSYSGIKV